MRDAQGRLPQGGRDVLRRLLRSRQDGRHLLRYGADAAHRRHAERAVHVHAAAAAGQHRHARRRHQRPPRRVERAGLHRHGPALQHPHRLPRQLRTTKKPISTPTRKRFSKTSYWSAGPAFFKSLLRAWYGDAATADNDYAYHYLPKSSGDYSWISLFEAMYAGKIKGLLCMGQNPAVSGPNSRFEREGAGEPRLARRHGPVRDGDRRLLEGAGRQSRRHPDGGVPPAGRRRRREGGQHLHQRPPHSVAPEGGERARRREGRLVDSQPARQGPEASLRGLLRFEGRPHHQPRLGLRRPAGRGTGGARDQRLRLR